MSGTGDIRGFTLLVQLWALERFPRIAERYIEGGDPLVDDSAPRGGSLVAVCYPHVVHRLHRMAPSRPLYSTVQIRSASPQDAEPTCHVEDLLAADFRSSVSDWRARYRQYLLHWEQRDQHIATGEVASDDLRHHFHDEYDK
ncbi:hypothetical protein LINPERHAP1_LOCUS26665, partial [Linum perenne]